MGYGGMGCRGRGVGGMGCSSGASELISGIFKTRVQFNHHILMCIYILRKVSYNIYV